MIFWLLFFLHHLRSKVVLARLRYIMIEFPCLCCSIALSQTEILNISAPGSHSSSHKWIILTLHVIVFILFYFCRWSNLLVAWGCPETNSIDAQWSHCLQNARPCLLFFAALMINLLLTPITPSLPYSEITVLSTVVSLLTLYNFVVSINLIFGDLVIYIWVIYNFAIVEKNATFWFQFLCELRAGTWW